MKSDTTILVIGTFDTKSAELAYLIGKIREQGADVVSMDVSVLGEADFLCDLTKHDVAAAASSSIEEAINSGDENVAMQIMAKGAAILTARLHAEHRINGMIALGGTMGTDLALDCARALPMGIPKYVVSTVSFSALIPADRLAPDVQMILWAGGLYGLNSICKSSLSQAAGAVVGSARAVEPPRPDRPVIGMMSLGSSCLSYMKRLRDPLEERGFELAVFHATGMGGMAFERLASEGYFAAVMDFALPELGNLIVGSVVSAGTERLLSAGRRGTPQLVAPGCLDLIDFPGWQDVPERFRSRPYHAHNRLIASAALNEEERRQTAKELVARLSQATGPVHLILPKHGIEEWDRKGEPAHDPQGLSAFFDEVASNWTGQFPKTELDCHINDDAFAHGVLEIFDAWVRSGIIRKEPPACQTA